MCLFCDRGIDTLIVAPHLRDHHHYCCHGFKKLKSIDSPPSSNYQPINCREFQSGERLLIARSSSSVAIPVTKEAFSTSLSPKTSPSPYSERQGISKRVAKCSTAPVPIRIKLENKENDFHFSDHWAGPTYSNSPPPSCLPMPTFSLQRKRSVSLNFPTVVSEIDLHPIAKSAPTSPGRDRRASPNNLFHTADSATKSLRRMLNLDTDNE